MFTREVVERTTRDGLKRESRVSRFCRGMISFDPKIRARVILFKLIGQDQVARILANGSPLLYTVQHVVSWS